MRYSAVGVLAVLLLASVPVGQAEDVDVTLVEDEAGDVMLVTPDGTVPAQAFDEFQDVDLRAVGIAAEDEESIRFFVEVASLEQSSQNPLPFSDPSYMIHFMYGEQGYRVRIYTVMGNPANDAMGRDPGAFVRLEAQVGELYYRGLAQGEGELAFSENRAYATIPRDAIVNHLQAPLSLGGELGGIWASATSMGSRDIPVGQTQQGGEPVVWAGPPRAIDQAPDDLVDLPVYTMATGVIKQKGGLVAVSDDPVRWTNGEASTLRFSAMVTNTFDQDIPLKVSIRGAKSEWTIAFSDSLTVPRGQWINVSFLVTIPFSHNHGNLHMFQAIFESVDKAHYAEADLGVYWPAVPQPAGHHDTIWLHSLVEEQDNDFFSAFGSGVHVWMSAIEDEEADTGVDVPAMMALPPNTFTDGKAIAFWRIQLEPALRMGLDFRPEDFGTMEIGLDFPVPVVDPQVRVSLRHIEMREPRGRSDNGFGEQTPLADASSAPLAGPVSGEKTFSLELEVQPEADKIPYGKRANIVLDVVVEATFLAGSGGSDASGTNPRLLPGSTWMQLPLNEYVEPLDLRFETDGSIELAATSDGQQREVNPGRTVVYTFDLQYHGSNSTTFATLITGTNAAWAEMVGDATFKVEPHGERRIGLAVSAPRGTSAGERADLTLTVLSTSNAAVQAGINTVTTVVTGVDIPDEADRKISLDKELTTKKDAPGFGLVALLGAIALALRRR